jgi:hypoxanthine phosphoribosyltransferase
MTAPDPFQYVREELAAVREAVHDDLAATRADMTALATEVRGYMARQEPRIAVLEHRVAVAEAAKKDNRATWFAFAVAALAWVPDLLQLLGK